MNEIDAIRARLAAATPGPWKARQDFIDGGCPDNSMTLNGGERGRYVGTVALHYDVKSANAEFIAHAPTDIARLLAAVSAVSDWAGRNRTGYYDEAQDDVVAILSAALTPAPDVTGGAGVGHGDDETKQDA